MLHDLEDSFKSMQVTNSYKSVKHLKSGDYIQYIKIVTDLYCKADTEAQMSVLLVLGHSKKGELTQIVRVWLLSVEQRGHVVNNK